MTPEAFSTLALRLGAAVQVRRVLDTTQFRVGSRAFATLGWPEAGWAVVKLSPRDQVAALALSEAVSIEPRRPRNSGVTLVWLKGIDEDAMAYILAAAFREAYAKAARARPARGRGAVLGAAKTAG
ncbi:MmcQ/YjbR family DNA-binding protein [Caulobacter hibisci]|uniref:MmcQ/YjbR family DNA-binding protein n=1 Tax=Caulobacter hibisci TaxID=2035993 RepID=A0ABS0SUB1_9CAUL|nr:MmcQ/YjbR family DNA-binding protein [Caulobacter hibisci]MBI1682846.1 MmcQ/YjbR family DNA-binding protein [Caulobacter hibisci]